MKNIATIGIIAVVALAIVAITLARKDRNKPMPGDASKALDKGPLFRIAWPQYELTGDELPLEYHKPVVVGAPERDTSQADSYVGIAVLNVGHGPVQRNAVLAETGQGA